MNPVQQAVEHVGSVAALAQALGVSKQSIYLWIAGKRGIPAEVCPAIEKLTDRKVSCEALRPDFDWAYLRGPVAAEADHA